MLLVLKTEIVSTYCLGMEIGIIRKLASATLRGKLDKMTGRKSSTSEKALSYREKKKSEGKAETSRASAGTKKGTKVQSEKKEEEGNRQAT